MSITTLPLNKLLLSDLNVRHTERDADIAALAEDIAARGLKQNLVVVPAHWTTSNVDEAEGKNRWADKFEVIAGGRRYQAMQLLAADGRLPEDHPVPVMVEERDQASETSLSENLHKVAMNPADEFAAFKAIVDQRMSPKHSESESAAVAYTARRFGATVRHVEGRLRLATLCPEVLDALRANAITLDIAKAYAGTSDHEVQRTVFNAVKKTPYTLTAKDIRNRLRGVTCSLDDHRMEFVGQIAYRAAGGRIETEMFMGSEGEQRVLDVALLEKLANEKGSELAQNMAKADGWKEGRFTLNSAYTVKKPEGFSLTYHSADQVSKTKRKKCIAIYGMDGDGISIEAFFAPATPAEPAPQHDWEAERRESARNYHIGLRAARLAVPQLTGGLLKGTELDGHTFWPKYQPRMVEEDPDDENFMLVAIQIRVPVADIEAHREEATRLIDEEAAEAERAEAERIAKLAEEFPDHVKPIEEPEDAEA
ncbi:MAG: ParB/RepB/Spo0J family partition protein [Novosphingobium sp.]|uniref:ParB/RepB/Spo0J family partition protein n=1 Tax=Novosphingobium sp. TaxID=1874826 RepID=UPI002732F506|nr:ParB/RepB/Spo0J family partition protein [Novosphingobium sp.]MDP3550640.1 ParB/RepB/Spo0J family partition protein [Novosphingobium sp.]